MNELSSESVIIHMKAALENAEQELGKALFDCADAQDRAARYEKDCKDLKKALRIMEPVVETLKPSSLSAALRQ